MEKFLYYEKINILKGSDQGIINDSVLIIDGKIQAFGKEARDMALENKIETSNSGNKIIAPLLVDIHSKLDKPISGFEDNLICIKDRAKKSGYGVIALMPDSTSWRDSPEKIPFQIDNENDLNILFWGAFTIDGKGIELTDHEDLIKSGVVGLSSNCFNDLSIIFKGISLNKNKSHPILFNIHKNSSRTNNIVFHDIQLLQSGLQEIDNWNCKHEIKKIYEIKNHFPNQNIIIKNISDINSCKELEKNKNIFSSISWWNLIADTGNLELNDIGWKADPPISNKKDREYFIHALENNLIQAIAVNSIPLNDQETFKPYNNRKAGLSSFELVLPLLWEELIFKRKWSITKLWNHLSFYPSNLLNLDEEKLKIGSKRWLIYDPEKIWINSQCNLGYDSPSNFPKKDKQIKGKVIYSGLVS